MKYEFKVPFQNVQAINRALQTWYMDKIAHVEKYHGLIDKISIYFQRFAIMCVYHTLREW
jgi:hypothetical protein